MPIGGAFGAQWSALCAPPACSYIAVNLLPNIILSHCNKILYTYQHRYYQHNIIQVMLWLIGICTVNKCQLCMTCSRKRLLVMLQADFAVHRATETSQTFHAWSLGSAWWWFECQPMNAWDVAPELLHLNSKGKCFSENTPPSLGDWWSSGLGGLSNPLIFNQIKLSCG